jgi:hypothetical protein
MLGQCERARVDAGMQQGGQRQGICMDTKPKEFCLYVGIRVVSWTGGAIQASMRCNEGCQHTLATRLRVCSGQRYAGA